MHVFAIMPYGCLSFSAWLQVPINSIVNDNEELRAMVYHLLDRESRANASGNWLPLQNLIGNGYAEFDSDAESSADEGSVTDMSDNEF